MKMAIKNWFRDHGFKFVLVIVTSAFTLGATYALMTDDIRELNQRVHNLNERVQSQNNNWNSLIERLDDRYVNEGEFDEFRKNINGRLKSIDGNVNYLIRLQVEGNNK